MKTKNTQAIIVCGLGYGDECKGSITDYLARTHHVHTVVRYNGGAQAAHNVVLADGRQHTFSQFGSATFIPEVRTHLSRYVMVNPIGMMMEAERLARIGIEDACERTTVDERALVITPFHCAANRLREIARGSGRHGSCGQGVGETANDAVSHPGIAIRVGDVRNLDLFKKKLKVVQNLKISQLEELLPHIPDTGVARRELKVLGSPGTVGNLMSWYEYFGKSVSLVPGEDLSGVLARPGTVIFEGAQGVLLDESKGFYPHVTWSKTTTENAYSLLEECGYAGDVQSIGLFRAYFTRHGQGPFVTEDPILTEKHPDRHNRTHEWQQGFRLGWFDVIAARYALSLAGRVDGVAISCLDTFQSFSSWKACVGYEHPRLGRFDRIESGDIAHQERLTRILKECRPVYRRFGNTTEYLRFLQEALGVPIVITSHGPTAEDKKDCRLVDSCSADVVRCP